MNKKTKKRKRAQKKIIYRIFDILSYCLLTLLLLITLVSFLAIKTGKKTGPPSIGGYQLYIVLSGSMNPTFDKGSLIIVKETDPKDLKEGDIITYYSREESSTAITHRIVSIEKGVELQFTTKGDANETNDPNPIKADRISGKVVFHLAYIGYILSFVKSFKGILIFIIVPGCIIIIYEVYKIILDFKGDKKRESKGTIGDNTTKEYHDENNSND